MERAGFLESGNSSAMITQMLAHLLLIGVTAPLLGILPFVFEVTSNPSEDVILTSLFLGVVTAPIPTLLGSSFSYEFERLFPFRIHTLVYTFILTVDHFVVSRT